MSFPEDGGVGGGPTWLPEFPTKKKRSVMLGDNSLEFEVKGRRLFEVCRTAVFNEYRINIGGTPVRYDDTEATYALSSDSKLTIAKKKEVLAFLRGVVAAWRSF